MNTISPEYGRENISLNGKLYISSGIKNNQGTSEHRALDYNKHISKSVEIYSTKR